MKTTITTRELSRLFSIRHTTITKNIRGSQHQDLFTPTSYVTAQNKVLECFIMGLDGLELLLGRAQFKRGDRLSISVNLLRSFGVDASVTLYEENSSEDGFYDMLQKFFRNSDVNIEREYSIAGFRVDFYIASSFLIIEFDEDYHNSESQKIKDKKREAKIKSYVMAEHDDHQEVIRVKAGQEIEGLAVIAGYLALSSSSAKDITDLYENQH